MENYLAKVDLHVHSKASSSPVGWMLSVLKCPECYTDPKELYKRLKNRGMTFVTITDHNTIDGVLEIAHMPDVFIGCEYTVKFPEEPIEIHILCYGMDEQQHKILNKLRDNVYDFVDYIKQNDLAYSLAHPLYAVNGNLITKYIVEKLILLFDNWEIINGTRSKNTETIEKTIAEKYNGWQKIRELEEKYNITSRRSRENISFTAGSDDHGGIDAGRTWTSAYAFTKKEFIDSLKTGDISIGSEELGEERLINTVVRVAYNYIKQHKNLSKEFREIADHLLMYKENKFIDVLIKRHLGVNSSRELLLKEIIRKCPFIAIERVKRQDYFRSIGEIFVSMLFQVLPTIIIYLQKAEEIRIKQVAQNLNISLKEKKRLAYVTDTYYEINGVSRTAQIIKTLTKKYCLPVDVITMSRGLNDDEDCINLFTYLDLPTPFYNEFRLRFPSLLDIFDLLKERDYSHVHISTPAPLGLLFLLAGKVFQLPVSFTFHTDVPAYVAKYTQSDVAQELVWNFFVFLSNFCDKILVPSKVYLKKLQSYGIPSTKIKTFLRGVDTNLFRPDRHDPLFWSTVLGFDVQDKTIVLFVGRVSKEKNLDLILKIASRLPDLVFVIVGDGPYRSILESKKPKNVFLVGYMEGEKLARAYSSSDIFLFPSETETYGLVILEAMASGLPVIVSSIGAAHEHIKHNYNGLIASSEEEFFHYTHILATNEGLRMKLSSEAFYTAKNLDLETTYLQYINEILFNKGFQNEAIRCYDLLSSEKWRNQEIYR